MIDKLTKEIVETPAEQLNPEIILKEKNAEVRREIVRKIGIERICQKLNAKVLDTSPNKMYELLELNVHGNKYQYLKMRNPSIGTYYIEGVINCKTWIDALNYRKPAAMKKIPVSENGQDWLQQGDVCIWPRKAKFLKPFPKILT